MLYLLFQKIRRNVNHFGLRAALKLYAQGLGTHVRRFFRRAESQFDRQFGLDTEGVVTLPFLKIPSANVLLGFNYQATPVDLFRRMMANLAISYEDWVFVDLGAGKGRTLLLASEYSFRDIIGVEFAPRLVNIAQNNIRRYQRRNALERNLSMVCVDAYHYQLPPHNVVLYLYNPFQEPVMQSVITKIRHHGHAVLVVYYNALLRELFETCDALFPVRIEKEYVIYGNAHSQRMLQGQDHNMGKAASLRFGISQDPS